MEIEKVERDKTGGKGGLLGNLPDTEFCKWDILHRTSIGC
jgi:hypothetical protein